jgi:group II intron reverse transcriptase/maturase
MEGKEQKISQDSYRQNNRTASEGYVGAQTYLGMIENHLTEVYFTEEGLMELILSPTNLNRAYKQVVGNRGVGGVDQMETQELLPWLQLHKEELLKSLYQGTYHPNPVRRVEIPKDNGKKRQLGIPTVIDRFIQQAIFQVLSPKYEKEFSDNSYGFRPGRNAHQALQQCQNYINEGYIYGVDIDLERFFDTVNQSNLIEILSRKVKDGRVVSLIHKYLRAGVMKGLFYEESKEGVPQGSPLSPLLSNIMLNELDKELEKRGHRFVRYADDGLIFSRSLRAAERIKGSIGSFIEKKLHLKVNEEKTKVGLVTTMKFLGYSFYKKEDEYRLRIHPKSIQKMKSRLKELTSRSNGKSQTERKSSIVKYIRGWVEYFKLADMKELLRRTDEWLRRRIRMCIWKSWKQVKTRIKNLIRCGINKPQACRAANSHKSYWRMSSHPIVHEAMSNDKLRNAGYLFLSDYYRKVTS